MTSPENEVKTTRFVGLATYAQNRPIEGNIVTVLDSAHESRGLNLIASYSRALPLHSIHELIATNETGKKPGESANQIAYLAFFEVTRGGCIIVGEKLIVEESVIGTVLGFDETHEPNHINIVIAVNQRQTGRQLNFSINNTLRFQK